MSKVTFTNSNNKSITNAALVFYPEGFDETKTYPAVVVSHPSTGVKEQTAGLYAEHLAKHGLITIAFDRSYQGESTGEPRLLENPYISTEDISAVVDYLTTLPYVDNQRIGAFGVCAGGGYTANAAIQDRRIKAVGTVSAVNLGQMYRNGWGNTTQPTDAVSYLEAASSARTADAQGGEPQTIPLAPVSEDEAKKVSEEWRQAWEYYRTPRAQKANAPSKITLRSVNQMTTYDAFNFADVYLTQPLLMVAGSIAGTRWMSEYLVEKAASKNKSLHIVEGSTHFSLYDSPTYVEEAVSKLGPFFAENLA